MQEWILVIAADLSRSGGKTVVGPETARVCRRAAKVARDHPTAFVCAPAGWSKRYKVFMGNGPIRYYLSRLGVHSLRLITPASRRMPCSTYGEVKTFARQLELLPRERDENRRIFMVVRWWHSYRARRLLMAQLNDEARRHTEITVVRVFSLDILFFLRELPAFFWNFLRGRFRRVK